jgi:hypothetical protein
LFSALLPFLAQTPRRWRSSNLLTQAKAEYAKLQ